MFKQVKSSNFWIFIACSLLICIPLAFYYGYTNTFLVAKGTQNAVALQSLGQMSEVIFMLILPFLFIRMGIKYVLLVGMIAWVLRYVMFALGYSGAEIILPMAIIGILFHGICYDFFFVAGQIYVDKALPKETRGRAQSFLTLTTLGVGTLIGGELSNYIVNANTDQTAEINWRMVWLIPAALAMIVAGLVRVFLSAVADRFSSR